MSRDILAAFDKAGIVTASTTYDIVGFPPMRLSAVKADGVWDRQDASA